MTTLDVENLANREGLAGRDFDLQRILRCDVIPQFLRDVNRVVGDTFWRRKTLSLSIGSGAQEADLPADWDHFEELRLVLSDGTMATDPLDYVGDTSGSVLGAEVATTPAEPSAYYVLPTTTADKFYKVKLSAPADAAYTLRGVYWWRIPFDEADPGADVSLNAYIPPDIQYGLVHGLRMKILEDRYGIRDERFIRSKDSYREWIESLYETPEAAPGGHKAVYAR
jgi:hypothetical protein